MTAQEGQRAAFYQLCGLAAVLVASTLVTPLAFKTWGDNAYIALTVPTALVVLAATRVAERAPTVHSLWLIFAAQPGSAVVD